MCRTLELINSKEQLFNMSAFSNVPRCAWIIIAIPAGILLLSFSWLIITYACVIKSAKVSSLNTPWLSITTKVETLDNNVQDILTKYNQLLLANTQLIQQLNAMANATPATAPTSTPKSSGNFSISVSPLLENAKHQSTLLMEQKQQLQDVSSELKNVKMQFHQLEKK